MTKSILRYFIVTLLVTLGLTSVLSATLISNNLLDDTKQKMLYSVKLIDYSMNYSGDMNKQINSMNPLTYSDDTRISVISPKGVVLADTYKKSILANHLSREEVQECLHSKNHVGYAIRQSETTKEKMLYVAYYHHNYIIRLSIPYSGIIEYLPALIPAFAISVLISFGVAYILSRKLAYRIAKPLTEISDALEGMSDDYRFDLNTYEYDEYNTIVYTIENLSHRLRKSMRQTRFEQKKIDAILRQMNEGFILLDEKNHVLSINQRAKMILGQIKERDSLVDHLYYPELINALESSEETKMIELKINHLYYNCYISKMVFGTALFFVDITAIKKGQAMREDFFSSVSHELKTPITSIRGYAELLAQGVITDEEQKKRMLEKIQGEVKNMSNLINDILMLSRLDNDDIEVEMVPLKMKTIVKDVLEDYESSIIKDHIEVKTEVEDVVYKGNNQQISTLLSNLISNAIKYNVDNGKLFVRVYKKDEDMKIEVEDTGIGIPLSDKARVFERFYRVDKGRSRAKGGTGLGLAIVKHIVSYNHGSVELSSKIDKGTKITVTLPMTQEMH